MYDKYIVKTFAVNSSGEEIADLDAKKVFDISLAEELIKSDSDRNLPVYIAKLDDGSEKYIFPLQGKGLWGPLWGYIALNNDMNTVFGVNFDHKSETPGLGAEINTLPFQLKFSDKKIFDTNGDLVSIALVKTGTIGNLHAVDAISGGTITSNGLAAMIDNCLRVYLPYIKNNKN